VKEIVFINQNAERWKKFETIINSKNGEQPDLLANLFIQITDDLSYAQTYFPESRITRYLNALASKTHQLIYKNKQENSSIIKHFWFYDFPLLIRQTRKYFYYSFSVFAFFMLVGIISALNDDNFVRFILGDNYVNYTLENIESNDPMAIYKSMGNVEMFVMIAINNLRVSFYAFAAGIFFSFGTYYMLMKNALMLGAFQTFFFTKGLLFQSILSIWIHGTLEIFAIIVAGSAGLVLGHSLLFPRTLPRAVAFKQGATDGVRIIIGLMPIIVVAAIFESFVTRFTSMPLYISAIFILASLSFIVWYFFIYPEKLFRKATGNLERTNYDLRKIIKRIFSAFSYENAENKPSFQMGVEPINIAYLLKYYDLTHNVKSAETIKAPIFLRIAIYAAILFNLFELSLLQPLTDKIQAIVTLAAFVAFTALFFISKMKKWGVLVYNISQIIVLGILISEMSFLAAYLIAIYVFTAIVFGKYFGEMD